MRENKTGYNLWFIVLVAYAISKSTAKYEKCIDRSLDKHYIYEELLAKRIFERSNEIKKSLLNKSTTSTSPQISQSTKAISGLNKYFSRFNQKKPADSSGPADKFAKTPKNPTLYCLAQMPLIYQNTPLNLSNIEIKNAKFVNTTIHPKDLLRLKNGILKKASSNTTQKNPSVIEAILNPFFLRAFKSKPDNSSTESTLNKNNSSHKNGLTEITSAKYNSFNEDILSVNKRKYSKLHSINDNLPSPPYYKAKSDNGRHFKMPGQRVDNGRYADGRRVFAYRSRNKDAMIISKPVRLLDMVKRGDSMGVLLNKTLVNFSSQIFNLLQEVNRDVQSGVEERSPNKLCKPVKKKNTGVNHNNISYELLRNSNVSEHRLR